MNLHAVIVQEPIQMLRNIKAWLEKGKAFAAEKKFDESVLLQARLAPDQYPLVKQVQSSCDSAKSNAARLAGREPPAHPDMETTVEELLQRIDTCIAFVETITEAELAVAEERKIALPWMQGKHIVGADLIRQLAFANFYFHVAHAYAILRHNGVPLGKMDYLGEVTLRD